MWTIFSRIAKTLLFVTNNPVYDNDLSKSTKGKKKLTNMSEEAREEKETDKEDLNGDKW